MASLLIRGGRVVSPEDGLDDKLDVLIEDGVIRGIGRDLAPAADETVDARGQVVSPGFIDLHAHLREPGDPKSETLETGLRAAVAGGFTAVCAMPNTKPVNDSAQATQRLIERAKQAGLARVFPIAAVSRGSEGETLTDFASLAEAGAVAFSDDGRPVKTAELMRRALVAAKPLGFPIIEHCEDLSLSAGGVINEGAVAEQLGVRGIPNSSEEVCLARDLLLAAETGARLHVAHLSTRGALELVRAGKRRGIRVTCEVTPHHFTLTDESVVEYGAQAKMNPPLRGAEDVSALIAGIAGGTVDAIATDHAPHAPPLKSKPLAQAPFGIIGLETALGLALTHLVHSERISLAQLIVLLSANPSRIINRIADPALGELRVGGVADLTIFDPQFEWTYRVAESRSKSRNSPFDGWKLKGAVTATIVAGRIAFRRPMGAAGGNGR
jgi:dihydroorotase